MSGFQRAAMLRTSLGGGWRGEWGAGPRFGSTHACVYRQRRVVHGVACGFYLTRRLLSAAVYDPAEHVAGLGPLSENPCARGKAIPRT